MMSQYGHDQGRTCTAPGRSHSCCSRGHPSIGSYGDLSQRQDTMLPHSSIKSKNGASRINSISLFSWNFIVIYASSNMYNRIKAYHTLQITVPEKAIQQQQNIVYNLRTITLILANLVLLESNREPLQKKFWCHRRIDYCFSIN